MKISYLNDELTKRVKRALKSGRKTKPFDAADHLTTPELIEAYLDEAIATGDAAVIRQALSVVARARRRLAGKANASRRRAVRGSPGPETAG